MAIATSSAPAPERVRALASADPILDAPGHMGLDDAVLDLSPKDAVVLRFYRWSGPAITFGYGQKRSLAVQLAAARGFMPRPPVRRPTGGGVVFHDGDVTFSIVFPWNRLSSPLDIYRGVHGALRETLPVASSASALWLGSGPDFPLHTACFSAPSPADLVDETGRKILGGALRRRKARGLYQGSLRPEFFAASARELENAVVRAARDFWGQEPVLRLPEPWLRAGRVLSEKYRSESWNAKR